MHQNLLKCLSILILRCYAKEMIYKYKKGVGLRVGVGIGWDGGVERRIEMSVLKKQ